MGTAETSARARGHWTRNQLIWGHMASFEASIRIVALVFVVAVIISMPFTQWSFWNIFPIDGRPVYLVLLLAPICVGALLFGPVLGGLLGFFAGGIAFAHAALFPFDFCEVHFMMSPATFVLFTAVGVVAGALFASHILDKARGSGRYVLIVVICIVISFAASCLMQFISFIYPIELQGVSDIQEHVLITPLGLFAQTLIDAAAMAICCSVAEMVLIRITVRADNRRLLDVFRGWMIAIAIIVFMLSSAAIFSAETYALRNEAVRNMASDVVYLKNQLTTQHDLDLNQLLVGYEPDLDGLVAIVDEDGIVRASDDHESLAPGESLLACLCRDTAGADVHALLDEYAQAGVSSTRVRGENNALSFDMAMLAMDHYDGGYVVTLRPSSMIYKDRLGIMVATTALAILLILSISFLAARLLEHVVIRRIDETNSSLEKITDGNLNERVTIRDSREFASLSAGINTTVATLKESIAEAEERNLQELMTAKAIQESSLPTDFPPFPDIDRFDIYASMKTAKEVGGDFYDFFLIDEDQLGFLIADVSGKGIPAALFMMTAKTQIRTYMESGLPVDEAVNAANHQLCIGNDAGMFVTAFICVLDYKTGILSYVNAGHNPPMLHHGLKWDWMREISGMPLGLFDGVPYKLLSQQLEAQDMLYLYTDGVTEAMDIDGALFGEARMEQTLYSYASMNPRSVCVGMRRAITDFTLDAEQSDDITMLAIKYGVPPEKKAVMILMAVETQLVHVCNFIHAELQRRGAPESVRNPLDIAAEELFVNVCRYAYPDATPDNPGEVRISFEYEANPPSLTVQIADDGVPFNPMAKPDAETPDDIFEVPIGGLGILMAKKSVDEMRYERVGDSNVLTFRKGW